MESISNLNYTEIVRWNELFWNRYNKAAEDKFWKHEIVAVKVLKCKICERNIDIVVKIKSTDRFNQTASLAKVKTSDALSWFYDHANYVDWNLDSIYNVLMHEQCLQAYKVFPV